MLPRKIAGSDAALISRGAPPPPHFRGKAQFFFLNFQIFFLKCAEKNILHLLVFTVDKIQYTNPITYKLKDLRGEDIQGSFYELELLEAKQDVFRIDKIIRRDYKKKQALVSWKGYSDDFNSWIPIKDLKNI